MQRCSFVVQFGKFCGIDVLTCLFAVILAPRDVVVYFERVILCPFMYEAVIQFTNDLGAVSILRPSVPGMGFPC